MMIVATKKNLESSRFGLHPWASIASSGHVLGLRPNTSQYAGPECLGQLYLVFLNDLSCFFLQVVLL